MLNVNCSKTTAKSSRGLYESAPCGQAYFIADGEPIEMFEFVRPLAEARGAPYPSTIIPPQIMLGFAYICEAIYHISGCLRIIGLSPIPPYITRAEVYKSGVTHNFEITKAIQELGYQPTIDSTAGSKELAAYYRKILTNEYYFRIPHVGWWIAITASMGMLATFVYTDTDYYELYERSLAKNHGLADAVRTMLLAPVAYNYRLSYFLFRSKQALQIIWYLAVAAHASEGIYAAYLAKKIGCGMTWIAWGCQTLILGYPSLVQLQNRQLWWQRVKVKDDKDS
jgi:hypothetical protein